MNELPLTPEQIKSLAIQFRIHKEKEIKKKIEDGEASLFEKESLNFIDQKKREEQEIKDKVKLEYLGLISAKNPDYPQASEVLVNYIKSKLIIYTTKEDEKSEVWIYKDGIYVPQGRSEIKYLLRDVLEAHYTIFIFNLVMAKIEPDTFIESATFFSSENIDEIPVLNGILNIHTLELTPHTPKKIFFNKLPVTYDPTAKCQKIERFLRDVLSKEEDIDLFYEIAGTALLKEYKFEKAAMFVGSGRNGKGKSILLLKMLFGIDNCCSVPLSALNPDSFSIFELFGKMLNLAGDIGSQDLKDTSMFKSLTGRDLVAGKRKFLNNVNFVNYAKFVFACNDLPMVYDLSKGFWDRWLLLEFPYTFVTQEEFNQTPKKDRKLLKIKDEEIIDKITTPEEMSGFLNESLVALARVLKRRRFSATAGSEEVKSKWIRMSNSFMAFCYDCLKEDYEGKISKKELRKRYADYCKTHKIAGKSDFVIKRVLQEMFGASEERTKVGDFDSTYEWSWLGIGWKNKRVIRFASRKQSKSKDCKEIYPYRRASDLLYRCKTPCSLDIQEEKLDTGKGVDNV